MSEGTVEELQERVHQLEDSLLFVNFLIFYTFHAFFSYIFTKQSALLQYKPPSAKIYLMNQEQSALFNNCNYFKHIKL